MEPRELKARSIAADILQMIDEVKSVGQDRALNLAITKLDEARLWLLEWVKE